MNAPQTAEHASIPPEVVEQFADAIARQMARRIPLSVDLWGYAEIGAFLKVSATHVAGQYATRADFPKAIRLPTLGKGLAHPRYKAREVIAWADKYLDKP